MCTLTLSNLFCTIFDESTKLNRIQMWAHTKKPLGDPLGDFVLSKCMCATCFKLDKNVHIFLLEKTSVHHKKLAVRYGQTRFPPIWKY